MVWVCSCLKQREKALTVERKHTQCVFSLSNLSISSNSSNSDGFCQRAKSKREREKADACCFSCSVRALVASNARKPFDWCRSSSSSFLSRTKFKFSSSNLLFAYSFLLLLLLLFLLLLLLPPLLLLLLLLPLRSIVVGSFTRKTQLALFDCWCWCCCCVVVL